MSGKAASPLIISCTKQCSVESVPSEQLGPTAFAELYATEHRSCYSSESRPVAPIGIKIWQSILPPLSCLFPRHIIFRGPLCIIGTEMILSEREKVTQTQVKYLVLVLPTQVNKQTKLKKIAHNECS